MDVGRGSRVSLPSPVPCRPRSDSDDISLCLLPSPPAPPTDRSSPPECRLSLCGRGEAPSVAAVTSKRPPCTVRSNARPTLYLTSRGYSRSTSITPFDSPAHLISASEDSNLPSAPDRVRRHSAETAARRMSARCARLLRRPCSPSTPPRTHSRVDYIPTDFSVLRSIMCTT